MNALVIFNSLLLFIFTLIHCVCCFCCCCCSCTCWDRCYTVSNTHTHTQVKRVHQKIAWLRTKSVCLHASRDQFCFEVKVQRILNGNSHHSMEFRSMFMQTMHKFNLFFSLAPILVATAASFFPPLSLFVEFELLKSGSRMKFERTSYALFWVHSHPFRSESSCTKITCDIKIDGAIKMVCVGQTDIKPVTICITPKT